METLFLILGTGQKVLQNVDSKEYKRTKYFLNSDTEKIVCESPFVGEAIIKLSKNKFSEVHIFGTNSSMWETLFAHSIISRERTSDYEELVSIFPRIWKSVEQRTLDKNPELIEWLEHYLTEYFEVKTFCHIIPVGENEQQLWEIFDYIIKLDIPQGKISFDITHGLRYQPFLILFTLFYINSIKDGKVKIGNIYYGALELQYSANNVGKAPIFEFGIFSELLQWINASEIFRKYKDPEDLSRLLNNYEKSEDLGEMIKNISFSYNTNLYNDIIELSKKLSDYKYDKENFPRTFDYIFPKIVEFSNDINKQSNKVNKLLKISQQQLKYHNYGQSILTLWEAIVEKYKSQKQIKNKFDAQKQFSEELKNKGDKIFTSEVKNSFDYLKKLKSIRNRIAHLDDINNRYEEINIESIRNLVNYFSGNLDKINF